MARGTEQMAENPKHHGEVEVPHIKLHNIKNVGNCASLDADDDDDAAVYLQQLGLNYGITARSRDRCSLVQSLSLSREGSTVSSAVSGVVSRQKAGRTLVEVATKVSQGGEGQLYRLLSAKRNHIQQLNSDVVFLHNRIKELEEQNRLMVRLSKRQEAALTRYQDMKSELPHIIEAHKIEINVLQEKLRRSTELNRRNAQKLKQNDERIIKLCAELAKLRELSKKRNLPERDQLNKKLSNVTQTLQEKEKDNEELARRLALLEKALKQQVMAEVGRHRATAKKLYNLQCEHHKLQDQLQEREREVMALQQYRRAAAGRNSSCTTTAASSRSGSVSGHRMSGRQNSSDSSAATPTSGIASAPDAISTSESRGSLALDSSTSRLPPISGDIRHRKESSTSVGASSNNFMSPEPQDVIPSRRSRHRSYASKDLIKLDFIECVEDRRLGRLRRNRRSPRPSTDDDLVTPRATPTPSPPTTPEPHPNSQQKFPGDDKDDGGRHPGHNDHRRRQRLTASLRGPRHGTTKESRKDGNTEQDQETSSGGDVGSVGIREFSLIEHYPPRERVTLNGGSSGGSDTACGESPPPVVSNQSVPSHLTQKDSPLPKSAALRRHYTVTSEEPRTVSSLSKLDCNSPTQPNRSAITP